MSGLPRFDPPGDITMAAPFWDAVQRGELVLPRCTVCGRWQWYPDGAGTDCAGGELDWVPVRGEGTVHTWTRVTRAFLPGGKGDVPYVVGFVELDDAPGLRLVTNLVDDDVSVRIGARVHATFVDLGPRRHLVFGA